MKRIIIAILVFHFSTFGFSQNSTDKITKEIVEEGKYLYRCEKAAWHGTDLFIEQYTDIENIGGYVAYPKNDQNLCVFYSSHDDPIVIGTIKFDSTFYLNNAIVDLTERPLSNLENELRLIREISIDQIKRDSSFQTFQNTKLNVIPVIREKDRKAYILTGPEVPNVVVFGNDYLITFNKKLKIKSKKSIHQNIIPIEYGQITEDGYEIKATIHNHTEETGKFISPTDVCTLMLYCEYTGWKTHQVVSQDHISFWNCETNTLFIVDRDFFKKTENKN